MTLLCVELDVNATNSTQVFTGLHFILTRCDALCNKRTEIITVVINDFIEGKVPAAFDVFFL